MLESTDENAKRKRRASPSPDGKKPWWVSKVPRRWWKSLCICTHRRAHVPDSFSSTDLPGGAGRIQPQQVLTVGPLVERELKGLQAAARQGAFSPSLCQEQSGTFTHQWAQQHAWRARRTKVGSLSGELAGVPQGTRFWAARVLICPWASLCLPPFLSNKKGQTLECVSSCLPVYRKKNSW